MLLLGPNFIAGSPWLFRDFRNIFLPNIGEEQKKVSPLERGAPSWYCAMVNLALVIALRSLKGLMMT